ncbi:sulfatase [Halobacterium hubeiense]|uniref:sulfatase n=1 Tax=Halobacterium hubeiense TaxID=1407499 RepID=UPI000B7E7F99|nr:sulfatase [Halobacterium hubeiense]
MDNWEHVVLLSADALRADHLSCYDYHRTTSPVLDTLAAEGIQFINAYSASSHTREAVPSLLTGRHPNDAVDRKYHLAADTISSALSDAGFATGGFHSNPFVSRAYGFDQGFDEFDDDLHLGQHKLVALAQRALDKLRNRHYARADEINERSLNWIDSLDDGESFFVWNHYMDTHGPYEPPGEYGTLYRDDRIPDSEAQSLYQRAIDDPESITADERQMLLDCYDGEIRYNDESIGAFLDALEERDLLDDSLIIFTADHGDAFGERGYYEHPRYVHDELVHVPLLVRAPGVEPTTVETPVSTLDIVATLLSKTGVFDGSLPGDNLLEVAANPEAFEDRIVFSSARGEDDDAHVRRFSARSSTGTWYADYDSNLDEATPPNDSEIPDSLHEHITGQVGGGDLSGGNDEDAVDDEIEDRLSALGYK